MARTAAWWVKQAYLALIPAYPAGYLVVHGFRGDQFWTKPYVDRSVFPPTEALKDLVESELDKIGDIKKAKVLVTLTDCGAPRSYGGFFLRPGVELQFPLRVSFDDVEYARRLAQNMELDLGLARHRRKIEVNSKVGEELISRMMLSDLAKKFIIQRELQIANSGVLFCAPIFAWFGIFGAGYAIVLGLSKVVGVALGSLAATCIGACVFRQFYKTYCLYKIKWADEKVVELWVVYAVVSSFS
ncbi:hypothetical protein ANCDUO_05268 [Ancylostoma duodenale]|uniref:Uncharacterized protein n=1 Tax=Ancylostoma duodenale TaxID=51022 RepID=A0A0C2H4X5_9BILA|nr:hypothetical protein ANCDUO_05268 [Ancylostoma duodenale]